MLLVSITLITSKKPYYKHSRQACLGLPHVFTCFKRQMFVQQKTSMLNKCETLHKPHLENFVYLNCVSKLCLAEEDLNMPEAL
jgi:hypothetical protein